MCLPVSGSLTRPRVDVPCRRARSGYSSGACGRGATHVRSSPYPSASPTEPGARRRSESATSPRSARPGRTGPQRRTSRRVNDEGERAGPRRPTLDWCHAVPGTHPALPRSARRRVGDADAATVRGVGIGLTPSCAITRPWTRSRSEPAGAGDRDAAAAGP
jgi:hypothetical protein